MLHYSDQFEPESSLLKYIRQETGRVLLVLYNYNCWFHYLFVNAYVDDSVLFFFALYNILDFDKPST